jgi:hypothetical protein
LKGVWAIRQVLTPGECSMSILISTMIMYTDDNKKSEVGAVR